MTHTATSNKDADQSLPILRLFCVSFDPMYSDGAHSVIYRARIRGHIRFLVQYTRGVQNLSSFVYLCQ